MRQPQGMHKALRCGRAAVKRHEDTWILELLTKLAMKTVCALRTRNGGLVIITGRGDSVDKIVGLEIGADDYVTKPFDLRELLAVLRRSSLAASAPIASLAAATPDRLSFAGWVLDLAARRLLDPQGQEVSLTTGEFDLLAAFVRHPGRVLSRDFLLESTHGREAAPFDRTIDVQVGRLRRKREADPEKPQLIKSVRSAGYILVPKVSWTSST